MGIIPAYATLWLSIIFSMGLFSRGEPGRGEPGREEPSSIRRIEPDRIAEKPLSSRVTDISTERIANPYRKIFSTLVPKAERPHNSEAVISQAQHEALKRIRAHDRDRISISSMDFAGYVERNGKLHFVDVISTKGLGLGGDDNSSGDVILTAVGKRGGSPVSKPDVIGYDLLVSFPEVESKDSGEITGGALHEFSLSSIDPVMDPQAREKAKAIYDAVAQYVDQGLDEGHLELFVKELQTMLRRQIYHPDPVGSIAPLKRLLHDAQQATNDKRAKSNPEHGADFRRLVKDRDSRPREPRENGNEVTLAIFTNELMAAERDLTENGETPERVQKVYDLRQEKKTIENLIDSEREEEDRDLMERKWIREDRDDA